MITNGCPSHAKKISQNIWYLDQNNLHAFVHHWASPSDNFSHLLQNLMLECLHFFPLPDYSLMINGRWYSWCAVSVFGIPLCSWVSAGGTKREFATTWKLGLRTKNFQKTWSQQLNWLNFCNEGFIFWYDTHTAQEPIHCCGVMQFWACSSHLSATLPRGRLRNLGADSSEIGLHYVTVTWQQSFTSSCVSRRLAACDCWRHLWQVMQRGNDCWLQ